MDRHLQECLEGKESTAYILPFFWQHGEELSVLKEEIDAIERAGIREFCVESRTHEDFGHEKWWTDFGFLLSEAESRGMRVWLLDDKRFPTGFANGYVLEHPELQKTLLRTEWRDFSGPRAHVHTIAAELRPGEEIVSVTAFSRVQNGPNFTGEPLDLTEKLKDGLISWDVPAGNWRVFTQIRTHEHRLYEGWIDPLVPESCEAMIHAVYQPTYEHFSRYFGNTFAGFFSDEPCMGNDGESYYSKLGKEGMSIPWRDDLPALIAARIGEIDGRFAGMTEAEVRKFLPALFQTYDGEIYRALRCTYMDVITRLYSENFARLLGDWCRAHNVLYIGHIIEDMNTHQRLGYGPGHYFRALQYEDMGGMDIVLQQIIPGVLDVDHAGPVCGNCLDPEFFNYYQGKLPTSQAHLTPRMQGRAMCEIYGAFGWAEGIPMMKQLTDHMISNGMNYFVPHAFSPKYPDPDCPPHFYARGMNPQFEAFEELMRYMRRSAHLITGGVHQAPAALLYTAEAEWGDAEQIYPQVIGKTLIRNQIDYDVVWEDILPEVKVSEGNILCGPETYRVLIVPETEWLPDTMIKELLRIRAAGGSVLITGEKKGVFEGTDIPAVPVRELAEKLRMDNVPEITLSPAHPLVRYHHTVRDGKNVYFFCSEDVFVDARFRVTLPEAGTYRFYDPWTNRLYMPETDGCDVKVYLPKNGAVFLIEDDSEAPLYDYMEEEWTPADFRNVKVSVKASGEDRFTAVEASVGDDITGLPGMSRFAGVIRYEGKLFAKGDETKLCLGEVGEIARVYVNGQTGEFTACEPYTVEICGLLRAGENELVIEVVNNLGYRERDSFSSYLTLPASGLLGPVGIR